MKKIPTVFERDDKHQIAPRVTPGCEWVLEGAGRATRKWDGTACLVQEGKLYARRTYRPRGIGLADEGFIETGEAGDAVIGWVPVVLEAPAFRWHREGWLAFVNDDRVHHGDGTYELVGPKVQGNPEGFVSHQLVKHGSVTVPGFPRTFDAMRDWFLARIYADWIEGVVWHHPDGQMAKIKANDFGFRRPKPQHIAAAQAVTV